jgi:hypothetical protein
MLEARKYCPSLYLAFTHDLVLVCRPGKGLPEGKPRRTRADVSGVLDSVEKGRRLSELGYGVIENPVSALETPLYI